MRKIFFTLLYLCIFNTSAIAASVTSCEMDENGNCSEGCEPDGREGCVVCSPGSYKSGINKDACTECVFPAGAIYKENNQSGLITACEWTATCTEGQYWVNGSSESGSDTFGCTACPGNYGPMGGSGELSVSGSGYTASSDITSGDVNNRCDANVITLLLHKNIDLSDTMYADHDVEAKYGVGFKIHDDDDDWAETINGAMQPNKKIIQFNGYNSASACNADMYFDTRGNLTQTWDALFGLGNPANLYACYTTSEVTINYFDPGDATEPWRTDTVGIDNGFVYNVVDYGGTYEDSGQVFLSYTCNTGDGGSCGGVQPGNPLRILVIDATEINLVAQFGACPAGFYCTGGNKIPCPAGTTSDAGSDAVRDCYMVAGENGTQFCDVNGCFTLPGTGNIAYE